MLDLGLGLKTRLWSGERPSGGGIDEQAADQTVRVIREGQGREIRSFVRWPSISSTFKNGRSLH